MPNFTEVWELGDTQRRKHPSDATKRVFVCYYCSCVIEGHEAQSLASLGKGPRRAVRRKGRTKVRTCKREREPYMYIYIYTHLYICMFID